MSWLGPWWLWVFVFGLIFGVALFLSVPGNDCGTAASTTEVAR